MNPKQVGVLLVAAGIFAAVQTGMMFQNKARALEVQVEESKSEERLLQTELTGHKTILTDLQKESDELLEFVDDWRPFFALMTEKQSAETGISMKVREEAMLTLSQRYQEIPHKINNKDNESLPVLLRATLLFDDNYSKLLNWFGMMEKIRPTMRVARLNLSKGSRGDDLRMELMLEVPLMKGGQQ